MWICYASRVAAVWLYNYSFAAHCLQVNVLSPGFLWSLSFLCRNSPASLRTWRIKPSISDQTSDNAPIQHVHASPCTVRYADTNWCRGDGFFNRSILPHASLTEGFFLLFTTLSARALFIKCFYFSILCLANRPVGGFLPLSAGLAAVGTQPLGFSQQFSWNVGSVLLASSSAPPWGGSYWCHHRNSDLNLGMGWPGWWERCWGPGGCTGTQQNTSLE